MREEETKTAHRQGKAIRGPQSGDVNRCGIPDVTLVPSQVEFQGWFCLFTENGVPFWPPLRFTSDCIPTGLIIFLPNWLVWATCNIKVIGS